MLKTHLPFAILLFAAPYAAADTYCDNYLSLGNPYPCCTAGNCTWWAWKEASDNWGIRLPGWGNANTWVNDARAAGFIVNPIPAPFTIGVNVTQYDPAIKQTDGHVVWITGVSADGQTVTTSEMSCGFTGVQTTSRPTSYFTNGGGGFIYPQNHAATPALTHSNPLFITHSSKNQLLTLYGSNLDKTKILYVTFPNGAHAILQGYGQIPMITPSSIEVNMTITTAGRWQIMIVGSNGADSNILYLNVQ